MATDYLMEKYKRFLLNRRTVSSGIVDCIENCLSNEAESSNQYFHKIMIHNWQDNISQVFDVLSGYYGTSFIPVNFASQGDVTSFYTSNLTLVLKLIKFDFIFPCSRNMFNVDVLFNDKTGTDFFGRVNTVEDIVSSVVCQRFNQNCELNLTNFCEDPEFVNNKIWFYKLSLLSQFKILMLRMGRDTKKLILSNNNLSDAPTEILNFFIKSDLTAIDLSYNNIPSLQELRRVSSKIEKLWIEGNPLCEDLDPITYVKTVVSKFPRLTELDGVKFNQHGITMAFFKNFLATPDKRTKTVIEDFVANYFSNFDSVTGVKPIANFYEERPTVTVVTDLTSPQAKLLQHHGLANRNFLNPVHRKKTESDPNYRMHNNQGKVVTHFSKWPQTVHDLSTFTVDVLCHNKSLLMLVIDGIFKELAGVYNPTENIYQFRRTFLFNIYTKNNISVYKIRNEMINISLATTEQIRYSFKSPNVSINRLTPIEPSVDEKDSLFKVFQHCTQLKKSEAEIILKKHSWNIFHALGELNQKLTDKTVSADMFIDEEDELSDMSSLLDEVD